MNTSMYGGIEGYISYCLKRPECIRLMQRHKMTLHEAITQCKSENMGWARFYELGAVEILGGCHTLIPLNAGHGFTCDGCGATQDAGTELMGCHGPACNFDLCAACVKGRMGILNTTTAQQEQQQHQQQVQQEQQEKQQVWPRLDWENDGSGTEEEW
jgi:hypothetical protein